MFVVYVRMVTRIYSLILRRIIFEVHVLLQLPIDIPISIVARTLLTVLTCSKPLADMDKRLSGI
jgi:hypothetical protein